ncbi:MAG: hypothetical protein IJO75_00860 [Clostridia bacterium]|nr:hypothetical protein [Clostridia bacterium]
MKKGVVLLFALLLILTMLAGCGEDKQSNETATTTESATTTTVLDDTVTTTVADATVTTTTTTAMTTTTTTTAKPTGTLHIVDPKNYKDNYYYVGALQPNGDSLIRPRILFEGEYAVVMHYTYSPVKEDDDQQPFEYQGKTYYGQGEGMSPYHFELTETEITVKDQNNNGAVVMKLILLSDGNMRVTVSTDAAFPVDLVLKPTAQ